MKFSAAEREKDEDRTTSKLPKVDRMPGTVDFERLVRATATKVWVIAGAS